jgi:hypothetical protein
MEKDTDKWRDRGRIFPLTLRHQVAVTIFLAGAPLAALIAFRRADLAVPARILVLSLGAVFAATVASALAFQILNFVEALEGAARRWRSGDLRYRVKPARTWCREFQSLAEVQNDMAVRLKRLYEREKEIAEALQGMLVSPLPRAWGPFAFADFYRAGSPTADVGGDFYSLFSLPDGRLGLLFGDIGGRGLDAAVKIAGLRYAMEAYAREGMDPAEMMALANGIICDAEYQIVTLVYLTLDPSDGSVELTNAGHEPPLLWSHEAVSWEALPGNGPALGVIPGMTYASNRFRLRPHDLLLLYTDGVASVGPKTGDWSTEDLLSRVRALPALGAAGVVGEVSLLLAPGEDDAALVAIERGPAPGGGRAR